MTYNRGSYGSKGFLVQALFSSLTVLKNCRLAFFSFDNTNVETQNRVHKPKNTDFGSGKTGPPILESATGLRFITRNDLCPTLILRQKNALVCRFFSELKVILRLIDGVNWRSVICYCNGVL